MVADGHGNKEMQLPSDCGALPSRTCESPLTHHPPSITTHHTSPQAFPLHGSVFMVYELWLRAFDL
eukprot:CAMPEP_0119535084 /NCGR_PEP_ID=MMETSP1344-20130328/48189_1 /TAXON_ID=236787 /ORGANISM="Florenciella parvula, Strain CCMP2471" /LENGTH=65 /DNA_ID=CAMNT_0007576559 /DNA_START=178 /DNA_END=371 /DNA_ORIENTATION=+